ncbi:MAG TPA: TRAP transporter substrate-binding protein [Acidimicrobiia bacterium]|nr:TRAP transporter substrate-binding protein [Acidimicrobiia bacterium]
MKAQRLLIGGYGPKESAHGEGLATFRQVIERETDGQVLVDVIWNIMEQGRPNTDLFDMVESGEMFLCYFSSSYLGDRVPHLNILETPYLFHDLDSAHRALDGSLGRALAEAVRVGAGFELLGLWDNGFRHFTNRHHPVRSPTDCAGMTVRLQPNAVHEELIRSWGAIPVPVDLKAGIEMIGRLEVDAQENPLANTVAYGVDKLHRFVTMTGHLYGARGLFAHAPTWDSFPPDLRATVSRAAQEAVSHQREAAEALEAKLRTRLEESGTEFVDLTPEEHAAFIEASAPAIVLAHSGVPVELFELAAP